MAKTAAQYKDEYINNNKKATQSAITEAQTANTNISNQYVKDMNAVIDQSVSNSVNKVQGEIDKLPTTYQSVFDANAVQQKINERQTKARMSDLGLTDSGLNRTQQTAIAIQRSNADAATRQQMNAASFSLKQQIADLRASGEGQKAEIAAKAKSDLAQQNQSVYSTLMGNLYSDANTYANNQIDADAKRYAADQQLASDTIKYTNDQVKYARSRGFDYDADGNLVYIGGIDDEDVREIIADASDVLQTVRDLDTANTEVENILDALYTYGYSGAEITAIEEALWTAYGSGFLPNSKAQVINRIAGAVGSEIFKNSSKYYTPTTTKKQTPTKKRYNTTTGYPGGKR